VEKRKQIKKISNQTLRQEDIKTFRTLAPPSNVYTLPGLQEAYHPTEGLLYGCPFHKAQ
jgi:hypothetical protein